MKFSSLSLYLRLSNKILWNNQLFTESSGVLWKLYNDIVWNTEEKKNTEIGLSLIYNSAKYLKI